MRVLWRDSGFACFSGCPTPGSSFGCQVCLGLKERTFCEQGEASVD